MSPHRKMGLLDAPRCAGRILSSFYLVDMLIQERFARFHSIEGPRDVTEVLRDGLRKRGTARETGSLDGSERRKEKRVEEGMRCFFAQ